MSRGPDNQVAGLLPGLSQKTPVNSSVPATRLSVKALTRVEAVGGGSPRFDHEKKEGWILLHKVHCVHFLGLPEKITTNMAI